MTEKKSPSEKSPRPHTERREEELRKMVQEDIEEQRRLLEKFQRKLN